MDRATASRDAYVAAGGKVVEVSAEDRAAWAAAMPNIAVEWANNLDNKGEPGSDMLKSYMKKLADAGFAPTRDWASEL